MGGAPEIDESIRIAHLSMVQGVISRMGANSFTLKALAATFGSAAIAVLASMDEPSIYYALSAAGPILIFWLMDAQYVRLERAFRKLFDCVRRGGEVDAYSFEVSPFLKDVPSVLRTAISWSVVWFYVVILVSITTFSLIIFLGR